MEGSKKKLSTGASLPKIVIFISLSLLVLLLTDYKETANVLLITYTASFIFLSSLMYYVLSRPGINYDEEHFYISGKAVIKVPLKNIQSVTSPVFSIIRGFTSYKIKYTLNNETKSIKFFSNDFMNTMDNFIKIVQTKNPKLISQV